MALINPRLSSNVHLLSIELDQTDALKTTAKSCEPPLSTYLWNLTEATRLKALETYFVQGIGDGTLNPTAFGGYMVQDSVYCNLAQGSIDIAANKASQETLKAFLQHESKSYTKYYQSLWKKWHIANANGIELGEACKAYSTFERSVAEDMDSIYFIVAMIPCLKLWPWLGQQLQGVTTI